LKKNLAEFTFGTWTAPAAGGVTVEYPLEIMDELRLAACGGLRQLARGGLEIGGVLFGSRRDQSIRLVNWRTIECEHSRGPALLLSDKDREGLRALLQSAEGEVDLRGLQPVGWFVSHTRSEVSLLDTDKEIFEVFFTEPWQVALVLHPERGGTCRAGFFVREDGAIQGGSSHQEFTIEALTDVAVPVAPGSSATGSSAQGPMQSGTATTALASRGPSLVRNSRGANPPLATRADTYWQPNFDAPGSSAPGRRGGSRWIWAIPGLLALVLAGAIVRDRVQPAQPKPISLRLQEHGDHITFSWDGNSPTVRGAFGGSIEIADGHGGDHLELTREQLRTGFINLTRQPSDLEATLILRLTGGATAREVARYVGQAGPPAAVDAETAQLRRERDRLLAENAKLKEKAHRDAVRAENAEGLVKILQKRLQLDGEKH
jgi:hypothetical protein